MKFKVVFGFACYVLGALVYIIRVLYIDMVLKRRRVRERERENNLAATQTHWDAPASFRTHSESKKVIQIRGRANETKFNEPSFAVNDILCNFVSEWRWKREMERKISAPDGYKRVRKFEMEEKMLHKRRALKN